MSTPARWAPGAAVLWRSVKDGVVRTAQPMRVVRDEEEPVALYLCPGTRGRRRKGRRGGPTGRQMLPDGWSGEYEETVWRQHRALLLHRPGSAHSVGLYWRAADGALVCWYVNLEAPWRRSPIGFDTRDHVLDLVVAPDLSSWSWKDEDEFAWAQEVGLIAPAEAAAIRAEGERAIGEIESPRVPLPRRLGALGARPRLDDPRAARELAGGRVTEWTAPPRPRFRRTPPSALPGRRALPVERTGGAAGVRR